MRVVCAQGKGGWGAQAGREAVQTAFQLPMPQPTPMCHRTTALLAVRGAWAETVAAAPRAWAVRPGSVSAPVMLRWISAQAALQAVNHAAQWQTYFPPQRAAPMGCLRVCSAHLAMSLFSLPAMPACRQRRDRWHRRKCGCGIFRVKNGSCLAEISKAATARAICTRFSRFWLARTALVNLAALARLVDGHPQAAIQLQCSG